MGFSLTCMASRSVVTCLLFLFFPTFKKLNRDFKRLHHGWLVFFLIPVTYPYSLWNLKNYLWMAKSIVSNKYVSWAYQTRNTNNRNELWKTVSLTSFQNPQLQSVTIFFKFVHLCLLLYLLCYLYLLLTFWLLFLSFTQFASGSHCLNFDKFRDTTPLDLN